jgi:hypothetical protein
MFTAFVGMIDNEYIETCIRGNGKTNALTYYLYRYYLKDKKIWTNYETTFSDEVIGFQEMINRLKQMYRDKKKINIILGVTEMQELINSLGSDKYQTLFVDSFANQMRKLNTDCLYDTQILKSINIKLRRHTDNIRIPFKFHLNEDSCNFDRCQEKHLIDIYSYKPFQKEKLRRIKSWEVGKLYNTMDIIIDKLEIPKEEKTQDIKIKTETIKKEIVINGD